MKTKNTLKAVFSRSSKLLAMMTAIAAYLAYSAGAQAASVAVLLALIFVVMDAQEVIAEHKEKVLGKDSEDVL